MPWDQSSHFSFFPSMIQCPGPCRCCASIESQEAFVGSEPLFLESPTAFPWFSTEYLVLLLIPPFSRPSHRPRSHPRPSLSFSPLSLSPPKQSHCHLVNPLRVLLCCHGHVHWHEKLPVHVLLLKHVCPSSRVHHVRSHVFLLDRGGAIVARIRNENSIQRLPFRLLRTLRRWCSWFLVFCSFSIVVVIVVIVVSCLSLGRSRRHRRRRRRLTVKLLAKLVSEFVVFLTKGMKSANFSLMACPGAVLGVPGPYGGGSQAFPQKLSNLCPCTGRRLQLGRSNGKKKHAAFPLRSPVVRHDVILQNVHK